METDGNFRKYFDALNKRLEKQFQSIDKRFDAIEATLKAHGEAIRSLQDTQALLLTTMTAIANAVKRLDERVSSLENRVEKLENKVDRLDHDMGVLTKMVIEIRGLESGKKLELKEVRYDEVEKTLTGTVREKHVQYRRKKK